MLLSMLTHTPLLIPPRWNLIQTTYPEILPEVTPTLVSYKVCKISEGATKLLMGQNSSKAYDSSENGSAGVVGMTVIPIYAGGQLPGPPL